MWGTGSCCSPLRDPVSSLECRASMTQIHPELFGTSKYRPTSSAVGSQDNFRRSLSLGNVTTGRTEFQVQEMQANQDMGRKHKLGNRRFQLGAVGREESQVEVGKQEVGEQILEEWVAIDESRDEGGKGAEAVDVHVEKIGSNMRKIVAKISIAATLEDVWRILTDYERLADFIPGLAVSELLEKRVNGARLYQVGEQDLALGVKFKAKAVVECEEKPCEVHPNRIRRDIDFETIEGDFQIFKGTWRMEQISGLSTFISQSVGGSPKNKTILYYILDVQPRIWLPVALVEGRLTSEVKTNLVCIRDKAQKSLPK